MLTINNREVDKITKKEIIIKRAKENSKYGYSLAILVNFLIENNEGYFTIDFALLKKILIYFLTGNILEISLDQLVRILS